MAQNFLSGKYAYVNSGGANYSFGKWELEMKAKMVPVPNFNGGGFEQYVPGLVGGKATISGPYDAGNMGLAVGGVGGGNSATMYTFNLGFGTGWSLPINGWIESIKPGTDVDGAAMVTITVQTNGTFTATLV